MKYTKLIMTALACGISATVSATLICVDLSEITEGTSLEGLDKVVPGLDIQNLSGEGGIVKIEADGLQDYTAYGADGDSLTRNGGLAADGGFANVALAKINKVHEYAFLFPGGVSLFELRMLDFGDFNPTNATSHSAVMTAYDADDNPVDDTKLEYTSDGKTNPRASVPYGELWNPNLPANGDALSGNAPGVWQWSVESSDPIVRIELKFPQGMDPKIGFDTLCYVPALIEIDINIHPNSDPNPLNLNSGGTTPVVIFGSENFDVSQIDLTTLRLAEAEIRAVGKAEKMLYSIEDIGSPDSAYFDNLGPADGYDDLVCHFVTSEIMGLENGEVVWACILGNLKEEFGGTEFEGCDVVKVVKW